MSAPYVSFTYFSNWVMISSVAEYVQLPTVSEPSAAIAALISSSVMSLFTIATCFVPAAALSDGAALDAPPPVLAAGEAVPPVDGDAPLVHALATMRTRPASAPIVPSLL